MGRKTQQNDITSSELLAKVNTENMRLLNDFIIYLKSIQRSEKTTKGYKNDIEIFFCWNLLNNKNKFFVEISKRDLISYQHYLLNDNKNSPARVRRMKSALSSMSNYIENILDSEYENFKPIINKVENPVNVAVRDKTVFTDDQLETLLQQLVGKKKYLQAAVVSLAMCSGARKAELSNFKLEYFNDENIIFGSLYKTNEKMKTKGRGLGKFIYRYVLVKEFKPYLDLWLAERERLGIDSEYLFMRKNSKGEFEKLKECTLDSWTITFTNFLNIPFYFHALRHYFTTHLARLNIPDSVIQEIIGWDSADMVKIYKDIDTDEQLGKYFDENGIKQIEKGSLDKL